MRPRAASPAPMRDWSPGASRNSSIAPESHTSAASRSEMPRPRFSRTSGPTPAPRSRRRTCGPACISSQGPFCVTATGAATRAAMSAIIRLASRREDEGERDEHLAPALGDGEPPRLDPRRHALLDAVVAERALLRVHLGDRAALVDGPGADQLAGQVGPRVELHLVAGADLRPVLVHDLADQ